MHYLSFDVGIKNLAYCISTEQGEIIEWDIINLNKNDKKKQSIIELSEVMYIELNDKFKEHDIDYVLIENQPVMKNPVMKSVQMLLYSFFVYLKTVERKYISHIAFVSATSKNTYCKNLNIELDVTPKNKYAFNKKLAIKCVEHILTMNKYEEALHFFNTNKKKDDLSDSYLQSLSYIEMNKKKKTKK